MYRVYIFLVSLIAAGILTVMGELFTFVFAMETMDDKQTRCEAVQIAGQGGAQARMTCDYPDLSGRTYEFITASTREGVLTCRYRRHQPKSLYGFKYDMVESFDCSRAR